MKIGNLTRLKCLLEKAEWRDHFLDGMTLHHKVSYCFLAQRKREKRLLDSQIQEPSNCVLQDMKETKKFDSLLQRCCNSRQTEAERVKALSQPSQQHQQFGRHQANDHFSIKFSPCTNHQRTPTVSQPSSAIHSLSIVQTHSSPRTQTSRQSLSTNTNSSSFPKRLTNCFANHFQVIVLLLAMCVLRGANAQDVPARCLRDFPHLACGDQLVRRYTYDAVEMHCKPAIEWPCQEYDDSMNSFGSMEECNQVCRNQVDTTAPPTPNPVTNSPTASSEQPTMASIEVCFERPMQSFCPDFFPPVTHYFYNAVTNECESFSFFNCNSFRNNFESLETCLTTCRDRLITTTESATTVATATEPTGLECCRSQSPPPPCNGSCPMECFLYNSESGRCESFRASSCEGSFSSEASCLETCTDSLSSTPPETSASDTRPSNHVTTPLSHVTTPSSHVTTPSKSEKLTTVVDSVQTTEKDGEPHSSGHTLSLLDFASIVLAVLAVGLVILLIVVVGVVKYKYRKAVKKHNQEMIEIKRKSIASFTDKHRHGYKHTQKMASTRTNIFGGDIV